MPHLLDQLAGVMLQLSARLPLGLSRAIGSGVGWLNHRLQTQTAKITRENIQLCYPKLSETEQQRLILNSLRHTAMALMETGAIWLRDYSWVKSKIVAVEGEALLQQKLQAERGLIVLAPHLGNWEVLGLYLSEQGKVTSLYQPPDNPVLEKIIRHSREKGGATLVPTNAKGVMALLKSLKAGGFTAILPDQAPDYKSGEFAPFFGIPALTMTLVHNLVQRTGSDLLMAYAQRVDGGFKIIFKPARDGIGGDDLVQSLTRLNDSIEDCVNDCPEQYQWEYKRFRKRRDDNDPVRYKYKKRNVSRDV